jgi:hypothetical protein
MRFRLLAFPILLSAGCALNDKDLCPESKGIRCATGTDCTRDSSRGCTVCQCSNPYPTAPNTPMRAPADPGRAGDPSNVPMR